MENKKTKLTISGSPKKNLKNFESTKSLGKKTVKINNQINKPVNKSSFNKTSKFKPQSFNNKKNIQFKNNSIFFKNYLSKLDKFKFKIDLTNHNDKDKIILYKN